MGQATDGRAPASRLGALASPGYRRFWLGSLASVGATQLLILGQGWLVFELSGSAFDLGLLGAASSLPTILVTLGGGVLADRLDKRRVLMATSLAVAALLVLLALLDLGGVVEVWHVLAIAALIGLVSGLDWPARQAIFPSLIERSQMMSAVALNSILWQGTRMILPALGGLVIAVTDTSVVFLLAAAGFVYMFAVLATLEVGSVVRPGSASLEAFVEGWRFIADNRLFAVLIPLSFVTTFFGTSYIQLMPAFADLLAVGERGFGALISATGVGSVAGTLLVGALGRVRPLGAFMLAGAGLAAAGLFAFAGVTGFAEVVPGAFYVALALACAVGVCNSVFLITSMTALQLRLPDALRGRVMGIHGITFSLIPLGGLFGGAVAEMASPPAAVATGASVVLAAVLWVAVREREVRSLDGRTL